MHKVDLQEKFTLFTEQWQPKIVGELNGQYVKIAKLKGEFVWHRHENEDELFLVVRGQLTIKLKDQDSGDIVLSEGQFFIVPRGVEHLPVAKNECHVMLFEPKTVRNTGNVQNERTVERSEKI
jgi:mannose-6-phosphate isomerase-like protein (cupin superfamily)